MPQLIDAKKRGRSLSPHEWHWVVQEFTKGALPDYQMAALLMAVWFRGLSHEELVALTDAMMRSGRTLDLSCVPRPTVDKHSTGGVGDKVSLALAPLVASAGAAVPMISGRGLGHTGGTLDKLASIPGYDVQLSVQRFVEQVCRVGCAITGQSPDMAPADGRIYALRDVTATVDSIPLIAASIMSKKLAAGPTSLVFDVKVGRGAFMQTVGEARTLARTLVSIGVGHGRRCVAVLTDMEQPLGYAVGNALEVHEAVQLLRNAGPPDLRQVTLRLGAEMLVCAGLCATLPEAERVLTGCLESGEALRTFVAMVEAQGGDPHVVDDPSVMGQAPVVREFAASDDGWVARCDARVVGELARWLGAGRTRIEEPVDPRVGLVVWAKVGQRVAKGEPLGQIHAPDEERASAALQSLSEAIVLSDTPSQPRALIIERVVPEGEEGGV